MLLQSSLAGWFAQHEGRSLSAQWCLAKARCCDIFQHFHFAENVQSLRPSALGSVPNPFHGVRYPGQPTTTACPSALSPGLPADARIFSMPQSKTIGAWAENSSTLPYALPTRTQPKSPQHEVHGRNSKFNGNRATDRPKPQCPSLLTLEPKRRLTFIEFNAPTMVGAQVCIPSFSPRPLHTSLRGSIYELSSCA